MEIKTVEIKNVKGLENSSFDLNLIPNKPNILVAPNGYGKSSFSIAFKSLNSCRLKLDKSDLYNGKEDNLPELKIVVKDGEKERILVADNNRNDISKEFDVFVINCQLNAKATLFNISGQRVAKSTLEILPNTIVSKIPDKYTLNYSYSEEKRSFGENGKIVPNIADIINNKSIFVKLHKNINFNKFNQLRILEKIQEFKNTTNNYKGNTEEIRKKVIENDIKKLISIDELKKISELLYSNNFESIKDLLDSYLGAIQLIRHFKDNSSIKKVIDYQHYLKVKQNYIEILNDIDSTRFKKKPKEDSKKGLIIDWPKANEISNGQRDILSFISSLFAAENFMNKKECILIIDEVFDYLDDANLVSCQYYITKYIENMRNDGREIFPIIMTHLDPNVFNHYYFDTHKIKIRYIKQVSICNSKDLLKIIRNRENELIKDSIDRYYLHFYPEDINILENMKKLNLNNNWGKSEEFRKTIYLQIKRYISDLGNYDSLAICIGIRIHIEKYLYDKISNEEEKSTFLNEHSTKSKIEYCLSLNIDVPEIFYLLGIIYNTNLYIKNNDDIVTPLKYKLENLTIKKMIKSVFEYI